MSNKASAIVFIGKRKGAIQAAQALNLPIILIHSAPVKVAERTQFAQVYSLDYSNGHINWENLAQEITQDWAVLGVFALVERAVLPAAYLRQALGVAGLDVPTAQRCTDKLLMKTCVRAVGLHCAEFMPTKTAFSNQDYVQALGLPLVLKARVGSGGRGTSIFYQAEDVPPILPADWMLESFVSGIEMSVESLVYEGEVIFSNFTEYFKPGWANILPAELPTDLANNIKMVNARAITALGIRNGLSHLEIYLTPGGVYFGELAIRPPGGYIMALMSLAYGYDLWTAFLQVGLGHRPDMPQKAQQVAGMWILHPGAGQISAVSGQDAAKNIPGIEQIQVRVSAGDQLGQREGVGQEAGHIVALGQNRQDVAQSLLEAHQTIAIEMIEAKPR